ncbi:thymidine kinase, cytosolic-like [Cimex lectularius]|uniref:Thymidine kinase n=1 Tax=Cimex lectularius TaxID=79782 RepID=A0A8I6RSZ3_CIMLE|nr:thymidine kinase, cytosolic-like [Cimex lectularius]
MASLDRCQSRKRSGELHLIFGPMFSGKTSELLKRIRLYKLSDSACVIVRYAKDTRYTRHIATHDGLATQAIPAVDLASVMCQIQEYDVIGIDEAQFFTDIEVCVRQLIEMGKIVIVDGLDATYRRTAFQNMLNLVPLSCSVVKLSAVCMSCGSKASFTKRIGIETDIEVIGGFEKYMAVCRECYKQPCPEKSSPFKKLEKLEYRLNRLENMNLQNCKRELTGL